MAAETTPPATIDWSDDALTLAIDVDAGGVARLARLAARTSADGGGSGPFSAVAAEKGPLPRGAGAATAGSAATGGAATAGSAATGAGAAPAALALVDLVLAGEGRNWSGHRYCESVAGARLRYAGHQGNTADEDPAGQWRQLRVDLDDPATGLRAEVFYQVLAGRSVLRSWVRLVNRGARAVTVESVTSFLCGGLSGPVPAGGPGGIGGPGGPDAMEALDVLWAENDWLGEGRWQRRALRDALPDLDRGAHGGDPRGMFGLTSTGTWSSGSYLPMGAVVNRHTGHAWAWQIEHNGAWHWQVGEATRRQPSFPGAPDGPDEGSLPGGTGQPAGHGRAGTRHGAYLALLGPADNEHHWRAVLAPGEAFTTVPVAVAVSRDGFGGAVAGLTAARRAIRRPHADHRRLPVIFNDYMNTLMGDPTTERLLPLVEAAAAAGAEYFVIDAGWYADLGAGWWDTVGLWKPSGNRFPRGITEVLDRIRAAGMVPGLWLEPEVVGVRSPVAERLPDAAFFSRDGQRVVENGRYHLDLRHPAAVKHLDEAIDFVVGDLGAGYLKLDYNVNAGPGTDAGGLSAGAGLLGHNRAHLDWLDAVLDRHPDLVIENCASGGGRSDYALLARLQLQSTSDQQDFLRYAAIAATAPAGVTPEQAAVWAYPQPEFGTGTIAFTLCSALLGRVHLSGHLDRMSQDQRRLVAEAVGVYKRIRRDLPDAFPFWPLGLPRWADSRLALGMRAPSATYLLAWHRGHGIRGAGDRPGEAGEADEAGEITLPVPHLRGRPAAAEVLYPAGGPARLAWRPDRAELAVSLPRPPSACLVQIV